MTKRYTVRETDRGAELRLSADYAEGKGDDEGSTHHFLVFDGRGYVYEELEGRPGTAGRQVCDDLFGLGNCRTSTDDDLPGLIRKLARRHCDRIDRGEHA